MTSKDNVVTMPGVLDRLAERILAALAKDPKVREDWINNNLEKADALATAKGQFPSTTKFGEWCSDNDFGENVLNKNDRAALIDFGKDLSRARTVLEKTDRWSVQHIHQNEWVDSERVPHVRNSGGSKLQEAKDKVLAQEAVTGKLPPANRHAAPPDISPSTYDRAVREIAAGREQAGPLKFTKAQEHHVEARIKIELAAELRKRETELDARVTKETKERIDFLLPGLEKLRDDAKRNEKYFREQLEKHAIFTEAEYTTILTCLHPDNSASKEKRDTAFKAFHAVKFQLTGKK